jgi:hypothetical protein
LCEGPDDAAFFQRLLTVRRIKPFDVRYTNRDSDRTGGNTKFGLKLNAIKVVPGYQNIRNVLIVSDNDTDPVASFRKIQSQITDAGLIAPAQELVASTSRPAVTIMMVPLNGRVGNLEYLCSHAAKRKVPKNSPAIEQFGAVLGSGQWTDSRKGKFELRAALAANCQRNPCVELTSVFRDQRYRSDDLVPLTDNSFRPVATILSSIP